MKPQEPPPLLALRSVASSTPSPRARPQLLLLLRQLLRQLLLLPVLLPALVMAAPLVAAVLVHSSQVLSPVLVLGMQLTGASAFALQSRASASPRP